MFQFSLLGLFLFVTVIALILATYFGAGRLAGMSTMEILTGGLGRFLYALPVVLVWIVGLSMAIQRLNRHRVPAILTIIALSGLMLTTVVLQVAQMVLIHLVQSNRISGSFMSGGLAATGILYAVSNTAWWILVVMAIFAGRSADGLGNKPTIPSGNPFQTDS